MRGGRSNIALAPASEASLLIARRRDSIRKDAKCGLAISLASLVSVIVVEWWGHPQTVALPALLLAPMGFVALRNLLRTIEAFAPEAARFLFLARCGDTSELPALLEALTLTPPATYGELAEALSDRLLDLDRGAIESTPGLQESLRERLRKLAANPPVMQGEPVQIAAISALGIFADGEDAALLQSVLLSARERGLAGLAASAGTALARVEPGTAVTLRRRGRSDAIP